MARLDPAQLALRACEKRRDRCRGARTISAARIDRWASSVRVTLVKGWSKEGRQLDARVCQSISGSRLSRVHHMRTRALRVAAAHNDDDAAGLPEGRKDKQQQQAGICREVFVRTFVINQ